MCLYLSAFLYVYFISLPVQSHHHTNFSLSLSRTHLHLVAIVITSSHNLTFSHTSLSLHHCCVSRTNSPQIANAHPTLSPSYPFAQPPRLTIPPHSSASRRQYPHARDCRPPRAAESRLTTGFPARTGHEGWREGGWRTPGWRKRVRNRWCTISLGRA